MRLRWITLLNHWGAELSPGCRSRTSTQMFVCLFIDALKLYSGSLEWPSVGVTRVPSNGALLCWLIEGHQVKVVKKTKVKVLKTHIFTELLQFQNLLCQYLVCLFCLTLFTCISYKNIIFNKECYCFVGIFCFFFPVTVLRCDWNWVQCFNGSSFILLYRLCYTSAHHFCSIKCTIKCRLWSKYSELSELLYHKLKLL